MKGVDMVASYCDYKTNKLKNVALFMMSVIAGIIISSLTIFYAGVGASGG